MKKLFTLGLSLTFASALVAGSIVIFSNKEKSTNNAESTTITYTMTLDENNRIQFKEDDANYKIGTVKTDLGSEIELTYSSDIDINAEGEFLAFPEQPDLFFSQLYTNVPVNGLYRVDYSLHDTIYFDYGYSKMNVDDTYHCVRLGSVEVTDSFYLDLSEGYPSYFRFYSYGLTKIHYLKFYYTCVASPDPHRRDGHWETEIHDSIVTLKGYHISTEEIPEDGVLIVPGYIGQDRVDYIDLNTLNNISWVKHIILPFVGQSRYLDDDRSHSFGSIFGSQSGNIYYHPIQQFGGTYYIPNSLKTVTVNGGNMLSHDDETVSLPDYGFYGVDMPNIIINGPHHEQEGLEGKISNIGQFTFANCQNLKELYLPYSINTIGNNAFAANPNLIIRCYGSVEITDAMNPNYARVTKRYLNTYSFNGVTYDLYDIDGEGSFANAIALEDNEVTTIHFDLPVTFDGVDYDVRSVANRAFENCVNLSRVYFPSNMEKVGHYAFKGDYRATFFIHDAITEAYLSNWNIDAGKYYDNYDGTTWTSHNVIYTILTDGRYVVLSVVDDTQSEYIFAAQIENTDVCFPSYFMEGNKNVTTINIPTRVKLNRGSFYNCSNLVTVNYSNTKESWGYQTHDVNVFAYTQVDTIHCTDGDVSY